MPDETEPLEEPGKRGVKQKKPLRWTLEAAAREFGLNPRTLRNRLVETLAGPDGRYSTKQIVAAIFTDTELEKRLTATAERELAQFKAAEAKKSLISTQDAYLAFSGVMFQVRRSVLLLSQISEALVGKSGAEIRSMLDTHSETILRQIASAKPEEILKDATHVTGSKS